MIDYIKQHHLSLLIVLYLVAVAVMGWTPGGGLGATTARTTVTNPWTFSQTVGVTATTTLSDTINFDNPAICINFYATSSATRLHLVASTTATLPNGAAAVMTAAYGACTN